MSTSEIPEVPELVARIAALTARVRDLESRLTSVFERLDTLELDQEVLWDDLQKRQRESKPWD